MHAHKLQLWVEHWTYWSSRWCSDWLFLTASNDNNWIVLHNEALQDTFCTSLISIVSLSVSCYTVLLSCPGCVCLRVEWWCYSCCRTVMRPSLPKLKQLYVHSSIMLFGLVGGFSPLIVSMSKVLSHSFHDFASKSHLKTHLFPTITDKLPAYLNAIRRSCNDTQCITVPNK